MGRSSVVEAPHQTGARAAFRGLVRTGDDGFSVIEIVVAMGIFALVASFMGQMLVGGFRGVLLGKRREVATQEANRMAEVARSLAYDQIGLVQTDPTLKHGQCDPNATAV